MNDFGHEYRAITHAQIELDKGGRLWVGGNAVDVEPPFDRPPLLSGVDRPTPQRQDHSCC